MRDKQCFDLPGVQSLAPPLRTRTQAHPYLIVLHAAVRHRGYRQLQGALRRRWWAEWLEDQPKKTVSIRDVLEGRQRPVLLARNDHDDRLRLTQGTENQAKRSQ
jgi:hypothetical protein